MSKNNHEVPSADRPIEELPISDWLNSLSSTEADLDPEEYVRAVVAGSAVTDYGEITRRAETRALAEARATEEKARSVGSRALQDPNKLAA